MSDYQKIAEVSPEILEFIRYRRAIRLRGDVLAYGSNIDCPSFSTDRQGFRHSVFGDQNLSLADCVRSEQYGVVLGASNTFGFGVAGNENTMPSILSEQVGFPFANCAMPGANSRNLATLLISLLARAPRAPSVVVLSSGGDLANFCEASTADPVFGSPNREQLAASARKGTKFPNAEKFLPSFLQFTSLWTSAIGRLCRAQGLSFVLVHQTTIFEKADRSEAEVHSQLGEAFNERQARQFGNHRQFNEVFYARRKSVADGLGVPLAGWSLTKELSFIDEFHCDRSGVRQLSEAVTDAIQATPRV